MITNSSTIDCIETTDENAFKSPQHFLHVDKYLLYCTIPKRDSLNNSNIVLRVHTVGSEAQQLVSFMGGLTEINIKYPIIHKRLILQKLNNDLMRTNNYKPRDAIDWLLESHIHVLLGHFHQGKVLFFSLINDHMSN